MRYFWIYFLASMDYMVTHLRWWGRLLCPSIIFPVFVLTLVVGVFSDLILMAFLDLVFGWSVSLAFPLHAVYVASVNGS